MANAQLLASDSFASGSLNAAWTVWFPAEPLCSVTASPPYYAEPAASGDDYGQVWTGLTWPADQISEATIQTLSGTDANQLTLFVRQQGASGNGYWAQIQSSTNTLKVLLRNNAPAVQIGSTVSSLTIASGDIWTFMAAGAVLSVYQNYKRVFYIGDATFPSGGSPGFYLFATSVATRAQVSSWRGYSGVQQDGVWQKQGVALASTSAELAIGVTGLYVMGQRTAKVLSGTVYYAFAQDNNAGVNYYESVDGKTAWTPYASNPVISGRGNSNIFLYQGTFYNFSQTFAGAGTGTVSRLTSSDGLTWSAPSVTNFVPGTLAGVPASAYPPQMIDVIGGVWTALFGSLNGTNGAPNTYLITSSDAGITWAVGNSNNPVIANALTDAATIKVGKKYYQWATANQPGQGNPSFSGFDPFETVLYSSADNGATWSFVHHSIHRTGLWESVNATSGGAYAICILQLGNRVGMYYTGSPSDNIQPSDYQVGLALAPVGSTIAGIVANPEDGLQQIATDAFTSGAGDLSANWTLPTGGTKLKIIAGPYVEPTATSTVCQAVYTGASFSANQYSEIVLQALTGTLAQSLVWPTVLSSTAALTNYEARIASPTGTSDAAAAIYKRVAGVATQIGPTGTIDPLVGDAFRLSVVTGSDGFPVLSLFQNEFLILQVQDQSATPLTTGNPGIQAESVLAIADAQIASWAGGNANVIPNYPPNNPQRSSVSK